MQWQRKNLFANAISQFGVLRKSFTYIDGKFSGTNLCKTFASIKPFDDAESNFLDELHYEIRRFHTLNVTTPRKLNTFIFINVFTYVHVTTIINTYVRTYDILLNTIHRRIHQSLTPKLTVEHVINYMQFMGK